MLLGRYRIHPSYIQNHPELNVSPSEYFSSLVVSLNNDDTVNIVIFLDNQYHNNLGVNFLQMRDVPVVTSWSHLENEGTPQETTVQDYNCFMFLESI